MIGKPPNLKLYVDSVIRQSPNRTTWCHSHDDIWDNIEPYKENSYVGHMTLNEIFLFCSRKGIKSKPFNKWWGRKTLSRHVNSFFKNESHVDFDNLPTHNDNGRYMKLSSVVEILYDLPIRNQISIIQTDKVLEVHPGGTRLALKDFYLDPVPVFLYSYEPIDFLEKVVLAKGERAYSVLKQAFRDRTPKKTYHALVQGHPDPASGTIDTPIARSQKHDYKFTISSTGKPAVTHYQVKEMLPSAALVEVGLETGRTHQIRVHFSHFRHPLVGDPLYGSDPKLAAKLDLDRQWLHAVKLGFSHPISGEWVEFTSDYPGDLEIALGRLRDVGFRL